MLSGRLSLDAVGTRMNCTAVEAARRLWSAPYREGALALIRLADAQAQLALSRARILAVERLTELVIDAESDDLARRAAVDLLRADVLDGDATAPTNDAAAEVVVDPNAVLAALERLTDSGHDNH